MPDGTLQLLVAAAQSASTSSNLQAWSVIAVDAPEMRAALADVAGGQKHVMTAPLFLVFLADLSRASRIGGKMDLPMDGLEYLESFLIAAIDASLAAQNCAVAAESLGMGVLFVGALRNDAARVARILYLPPKCVAVFGMCVGYPDSAVTTDIKPRLPQGVVLHRNRYDHGSREQEIAAYDERMSAFRADQGMTPAAWSEQVATRLKDARSLTGRHVLRQALLDLGFGLR